MNTVRTTITIKPGLLAQLKWYARHHERTLSDVIEEGATTVLTKNTHSERKTMYDKLFALQKKIAAVSKPDPRYTNKSVNDILYGNEGAWRGSDTEDHEQ